MLDRESDHCFDLARVAHVGLQKGSGGADLTGDTAAAVFVHVGDDHARALGGEQARRGRPDSRGGPCDAGYFAVQLAHRVRVLP